MYIQPMESIVKNHSQLPDKYMNDTVFFKEPEDTYVISRIKNGDTLSFYGDDKWNFNPYKSNPSQYAILNFKDSKLNDERIKEIKRLLFSFIIFGSGRNGSTYSIVTIKALYTHGILPLAKHASKNNITLTNILSSSSLLKNYILKSPRTLSQDININTFFNFLQNIDNRILNIDFKEDETLHKIIKDRISKESQKQHQTLTIPSRILSESIKQRWEQISEIENNLESLLEFTKSFLESECFAIAESNYRKFNCHKKNNSCTWNNAVKKYKLNVLFSKYKVTRRGIYQGFIKKLQGTCKHLIHAYTGMRNGEVLNLSMDCLSKLDNGKIVRLISTTTKLSGGITQAQWVTTKEVERIINILSSLNNVILSHYSYSDKEKPLFLKTSLICANSKSMEMQSIFSIGFKDNEQLPLNDDKLILTGKDIQEIENIDYNTHFKESNIIFIGNLWKFKSHQYRRSLAVYSIQSGLVSLGSLKVQFKHLFREMTMYYSNGSSYAKNILHTNDNHIANDIKKIKPEIDAISFIQEVVFCDEALFGRAKINNHILGDRKATIKKFTQGDIAYKETSLGACLSIDTCNEHITRNLYACVNCDSGVIKLSKINKVIEEQKNFISKLEDDSIEHRTEKFQLSELEKQRKLLLESKE